MDFTAGVVSKLQNDLSPQWLGFSWLEGSDYFLFQFQTQPQQLCVVPRTGSCWWEEIEAADARWMHGSRVRGKEIHGLKKQEMDSSELGMKMCFALPPSLCWLL